MLNKEENYSLVIETKSLPLEENQEDIASLETVLLTNPPLKIARAVAVLKNCYSF